MAKDTGSNQTPSSTGAKPVITVRPINIPTSGLIVKGFSDTLNAATGSSNKGGNNGANKGTGNKDKH